MAGQYLVLRFQSRHARNVAAYAALSAVDIDGEIIEALEFVQMFRGIEHFESVRMYARLEWLFVRVYLHAVVSADFEPAHFGVIAVLLRIQVIVEEFLGASRITLDKRRRGSVAVVFERSFAVETDAFHSVAQRECETVTLHFLLRNERKFNVYTAVRIEFVKGAQFLDVRHFPVYGYGNLAFVGHHVYATHSQSLLRPLESVDAHIPLGYRDIHLRQAVVVDGGAVKTELERLFEFLLALLVYTDDLTRLLVYDRAASAEAYDDLDVGCRVF